MYTHLLALSPGRRSIVRVDVSDGATTDLFTGLTDFPDGIAVDPRCGVVYWTNMGAPALPADRPARSEADLDFSGRTGSLECVALDGSARGFLLPQGSFVTGKQLAGAWASDRLYWSDREGAAVRSVSITTAEMRDEIVVATTDEERRRDRNQCVGVAVDERNGLLYWTQKGPSDGGDGRIFRAAQNDSVGERDAEVLWSGLPEPIDLELDLAAGQLYWTDRGSPPNGNTLNRADIPAAGAPGGAVEVVAADFHEAIGLALDTDAGVVYVSDLSGEIRAVGIDGRSQRTVTTVRGGLTGIAGI